jgi:hypothetical protein
LGIEVLVVVATVAEAEEEEESAMEVEGRREGAQGFDTKL